jgi:hypothetical protein
VPVLLVDRKELDSYFRRGADEGWKKFYRAHPKASGTVAFSAVGFNDKRTAGPHWPNEFCIFAEQHLPVVVQQAGSYPIEGEGHSQDLLDGRRGQRAL